MDYRKEYNSIIENRKLNILKEDEYGEDHHIKPRCFFEQGTSKEEIDKDNIVRVTGEEHYELHYLLYNSYEENTEERKLALSCYLAMCIATESQDRDYKVNAKRYQEAQEEYRNFCEKEGLLLVNEIIDFIKTNGHNPRDKRGSCNDVYETSLAYKLIHLRQAKKGNQTTHLFFESYQKLADENNLSDLFDTREYDKEAQNKLIEICEWIKDNDGIYPKGGSKKTEPEKSYAKKISRWKASRNTNAKGYWSLDLQVIAEGYGYEDLFWSLEEIEINKLTKILEWCKYENKYPNQKSNDKLEVSYYNVVSRLQSSEKKNKLSDESKELIEEIQKFNIYHSDRKTYNENVDNTEEIDKLKVVLEWVKNNRFPSQGKSADKEEKSYYGLIKRMRTKLKDNKISDSSKKILEEIEKLK